MFDKEKASLSKGGGTAPCAVTEDSLHRAVLYHRGIFGKIGAKESSVTPHSGATAPLLKEPFFVSIRFYRFDEFSGSLLIFSSRAV